MSRDELQGGINEIIEAGMEDFSTAPMVRSLKAKTKKAVVPEYEIDWAAQANATVITDVLTTYTSANASNIATGYTASSIKK